MKKILNFLFRLLEEYVFIPTFVITLSVAAICIAPLCWIYDFFQYRWIMANGTEEQIRKAQKIYFEHKRTKKSILICRKINQTCCITLR